MKVLFLTNIPSPYRIAFFEELGKHCDLTVWFEARNESNRSWKIEELGRSFRFRFLKGITLGLDKHLNVSIIRALKAESFDIYVLGCYSSPTEIIAMHWLKLHRKPFILNSDGGFPRQERPLIRKLKTYLISSAHSWLSSGSQCTRYLLHYGADLRRIYEYPLASHVPAERDLLPLSDNEKAILKQRDNLPGIVLLAIGQFIPRKGFDVLLQAFGRMQKERPDMRCSLLLVGGGPDQARYERMIREQGIRHVTIKGFMQREELIPYWKIADMFVLPTRHDVWGLVINEAAAFGLPIVTTAMAGAASDLGKDGDNGFIVQPDDEAALAQACLQLAQNADLRKRCGSRSKEIARRYAMSRMVERHVQVLQAWHAEAGPHRTAVQRHSHRESAGLSSNISQRSD